MATVQLGHACVLTHWRRAAFVVKDAGLRSSLARADRGQVPEARSLKPVAAQSIQRDRPVRKRLWIARDGRVVNILFASTRGRDKKGLLGLNEERSKILRFGLAKVRVPKFHQIGRVERPMHLSLFRWTIFRRPVNPQLHFCLKRTSHFEDREFFAHVRASPNKTALLFVHGYNHSAEDAVFRLAQIVWDIQFEGLPIAFIWPSRAQALDYPYDRESALYSRAFFSNLIDQLFEQGDVDAIHVVAHSMGSQIVMDALSERNRKRDVGEIILAAPDVDRDVFLSLAPQVRLIAKGVTVYASSADRALQVSGWLAKSPRAGDVPEGGPIVLAGIETIDVSAIGDHALGLNHGTFSDARSTIDDLGHLIYSGTRPPHIRSPQICRMPEPPASTRYWRYVP